MKSKIKLLNYQRNGVCGYGFFTVRFNDISDTKGDFIATFETKEDGEKEIIDITTCRVVEMSDLCKGWRGDRIAEEIQTMINTYKTKFNLASWYDVSIHLQNKGKSPKNKHPVYYKSVDAATQK